MRATSAHTARFTGEEMLIKNPESSRAHRQYVRPNRFNEVATLENLESHNRFSVCSRSGAIEDSLFMIDTQICVMQTCIINDNL